MQWHYPIVSLAALAATIPPYAYVNRAAAEPGKALIEKGGNTRATQQNYTSNGSLNSTSLVVEDKGCPDRQDRRNSDLCAQWKAADAAASQARIGWIGLLLSTATMAAAVAAAKFARDAARETQRGAVAAEQTLQNNRAWITFDGYDVQFLQHTIIDGEHRDNAIGFSLRWINSGGSPAVNAKTGVRHIMVSPGGPTPTFDIPVDPRDESSQSTAPIGPRKNLSTVNRIIHGEDYDLFISGKMSMLFYCIVRYYDIYSPSHERISEICLQVLRNGTLDSGMPHFQVIPRGRQNSAT